MYAEWILNLKLVLQMYTVGEDSTIWDIVKGEYVNPQNFPIHAMLEFRRRLSQNGIRPIYCPVHHRTSLMPRPPADYCSFRAHYEREMFADIGRLVEKVMKMTLDDRISTIEEYTGGFERNWSFMRSTIKWKLPSKPKWTQADPWKTQLCSTWRKTGLHGL